jgi:hypothetical protein
VQGQVDEVRRWSWAEFQGLPRESVSVDTLLTDVVMVAEFAVAFSDGG